jgi:hypothetical protein
MENVLAQLNETSVKHELHPNHQPPLLYQGITPTISSLSALEETGEDKQQLKEVNQYRGVIHPISASANSSTKGIARILNNSLIPFTSIPTVRVHVDGGANRSITNDSANLRNYKNIKKYPMSGVAAGEAALICTGVGYLPWQADTGEVVLVRCYYSPDAADTILSPTDIVLNNIHDILIQWPVVSYKNP